MSKTQNLAEGPSSTKAEENRVELNSLEKGQRFTPLRSYVTRAKALSREARGDLALSRLIPAARLES